MNPIRLFRGLVPRRAISPREALCRLIATCPVCDLDLTGHSYAELASIIANDSVKRSEAESAVASRDWRRIATFHEWDAEADVIEYRAIRCSRRGEVGLLKILFTSELWDDDVVQERRRLTMDESRNVLDLSEIEWFPF